MKIPFAEFSKNIKKSYVVLAVVAIIAFDLIARASYSAWSIDPLNSPNRSWIWYAVQDFKRNKTAPDIVLLGSSLMMAVVHGGDATYFKVPENSAFHHRSFLLEKLIKDKYDLTCRTFAFVIGGQMVSDAYIIASRLLVGNEKPKMIVYGTAPRDFMDNTLASPASTETYRYLSRISNLSDLDWQSHVSPWEKVECAAAKLSFLYNKRLDFVYLQNLGTKNLLATLFGMKDLEAVHAPFALRGTAMLQLPEDTGPGEVCVSPYDKNTAKYQDNLNQYRYRYLPFKAKPYNTQMDYLNRLLAWAHSQKIDLVLVNMPITKENMDIMPEGFYKAYLNSIKVIAQSNQAQFIDLNESGLFPKVDFEDSVHLNGLGGEKFMQVLSDKLYAGKQIVARQDGSAKPQ